MHNSSAEIQKGLSHFLFTLSLSVSLSLFLSLTHAFSLSNEYLSVIMLHVRASRAISLSLLCSDRNRTLKLYSSLKISDYMACNGACCAYSFVMRNERVKTDVQNASFSVGRQKRRRTYARVPRGNESK